jgi:hypothetical protein
VYALNDPITNIDPTGKCVPYVEEDCLPVWELDQGLNWADGREYVEVAIVDPVLGIVTTAQTVVDDPGILLRGATYLSNNPIDSALVIGQTALMPFTDIYEGLTCRDMDQLGRGLASFGMLLGGARLARTSRAAPIQQSTAATSVASTQAARLGLVVLTRDRILKLAGFSERGIPIIIDESIHRFADVATALRNRGYNARTIPEIYGTRGLRDPVIYDLAESIDARVLSVDRGHDMAGGFFRRTIRVDGRVRQTDSVVRIVEEELGTP